MRSMQLLLNRYRSLRLGCLLGLWLGLSALPLAAQSNAERMANDHYSRSHDYDLIHERIELSRFDWDSLSFDGKVTLTLRALRPDFDSVLVDAGPLLDIQRLTGPRGAVLRHAASGDTLVVYLGERLAFGDTVRFTMEYHGRVENGQGLTFIDADQGPPRRPRQLWSQGEDHNNHYWFPTYDFPNDKATWEIVVTVPRGFTAVSNGRLALDRTNRDGTRTFDWLQELPSATYLVSLVVAPLARVRDMWRGRPVDAYVYREDSALARPLFRVTPDMIEVYSRLTGVPYPWNKYAQTTVADFFGGMENVSATTLVDWLPDARAYLDEPWYQHILIPHELAHQWFGDYTTTANWANMWLNEGFAEFMPGQYWKEKLGRHSAEDYYLDEYRQFVRLDARRRMPLASLGSNNIYPKGALVLEMLRQYLGDARFWASVTRYLKDHALDVAVTDDFRQAVLAATGENLDWFWDEWFYQAGYPEFKVSAAYDSTARSLTLQVSQTQADSSTPDSTGLRYTTPAVFRMPVTIRVGTAAGELTRRVWLESREDTVPFAGLATPPTMVVFDADNAIVKTLTFDQPTEWLAAQLGRDSNLWNRQWVIGQLARRTGDSTAGRALARAATGADYYLTRMQAVAALSQFPGPEAAAAALVAVRDTASRVRAAALETLGALGGAEAQAATMHAWVTDSSYEVRAAALSAAIKLNPTGAAALIRQGLATPSYQDVIVDAALGGVVQTADTTLLAGVDSALGWSDHAGYVLAAFAARGYGPALERLAARLGDARPMVRHRAQQAFEFGLPRETALPALKAALDGVTEAKARAELAELISKLARPS